MVYTMDASLRSALSQTFIEMGLPGPGEGMTAEQILEAALDIIEKRGWTKGQFSNENGVCMLGALNKASNYSSAAPPHLAHKNRAGYEEAVKMIERVLLDSGYQLSALESPYAVHNFIPAYNDDPSVTLEDVRLTLKRAMEVEHA